MFTHVTVLIILELGFYTAVYYCFCFKQVKRTHAKKLIAGVKVLKIKDAENDDYLMDTDYVLTKSRAQKLEKIKDLLSHESDVKVDDAAVKKLVKQDIENMKRPINQLVMQGLQ